MGYMRHHAIIVTGFQEEAVTRAHAEAAERFSGAASHPEGAYDGNLAEVSPVMQSAVNSYFTFFVAPDGSKEGWGQSDRGDEVRKAFLTWLKDQHNHRRYFDYVEVSYGADDQPAKIITDSNDIREVGDV